MPSHFLFSPLSDESQRFLCNKMNFPSQHVIQHGFKETKILGPPLKTCRIVGDGNCLFRALSYAITGRQSYHRDIRSKVVHHMKTIEHDLKPHLNCSVDHYLENSRMNTDGTWGTDIEIFAAASYLSTDIYVYTNVNNAYRWHLFSLNMLNGSSPENKGAIYIEHVNRVHYDVVIDVGLHHIPASRLSNDLKRAQSVQSEHHSIKRSKLTVAPKQDSNFSSTKVKRSNRERILPEINNKELKENEQQFHESKPFNHSDSFKGSKVTFASKHDSFTSDSKVQISNKEDILPGVTCEEAEKNMQNFHKSMQFNIVQCNICHEAWPLRTKPKSVSTYICTKCARDKETPKKFSNENLMIPSKVPTQLQGLTQTEEMLIARVLPIMRVYVRPGGQRGYCGHCVNLPQNVKEIADSLPRCPSQLPLICVTMKGQKNTFKDVYVRKSKVENALTWLTKNNPQYRDIKIDTKILDSLPENGVPTTLPTIESQDLNDVESEVSCNVEKDKIDDSDVVYNYDTDTNSFLPESTNNDLELDAIQAELGHVDWPSIESNPVNEFTTHFLATMAFPTLFPDGKGDPTNPCLLRDIPLGNKFQHLIKFAENVNGKWIYRFASHPRFSYWALNMIQRQRALQQSSIFLKQNPGESHLTIDELREMANNNTSSGFMSKLSRYIGNVTGSAAYWHRVREDLKAIIDSKGVPTIFFTFSAADMHWPELHSLFHSTLSDLNNNDRRQAIIDNPHIVDWMFTKRIESFLKHWLYDTLKAEWHWYRYEYQARGSIHCHGTAKLKTDPGLCNLTEIALKGYLAGKELLNKDGDLQLLHNIKEGNEACEKICQYVDSILSTENPIPPDQTTWIKPDLHPCKRVFKDIPNSELEDDYINLLNSVQRHTRCSTSYCLRQNGENSELLCRFKYPFDLANKTHLVFEPVNSKDKSIKYRAKLVTKRNDSRLNNHQKVQIQGWRANCDIQIIIDQHACVEYLTKYAAKGEPKSPMLTNAFKSVLQSVHLNTKPHKAIKKIMMKTIGERDYSAQETMHLLLSLKLYSSSFDVLPINLNGSRKVFTNVKDESICTSQSLLDIYANRINLRCHVPDIMDMNFVEFASKYKVVKGKLQQRPPNVVPRIFPSYPSNPKGVHYENYCKYNLLKFKPWETTPNNILTDDELQEKPHAAEWHTFLETPYAKIHVPNWYEKFHDVLENLEQVDVHFEENNDQSQEEWMILSNYHNSSETFDSKPTGDQSIDWHLDSVKYSHEQIGSMPNWIEKHKDTYSIPCSIKLQPSDPNTFSEKQKLAYNIILKHANDITNIEPLLMIINGEAGTGKSYLINAIQCYLKELCVVTATTGKASFNVNGITIHSLLKLPVASYSHKDLSGHPLLNLQEKLKSVQYILIDEYSMLGQTTFGWIDRRCRQASGKNEQLFGGKSIILIGDPAQLPPVADKPLYHSVPSTAIGEQGYLAYRMFNSVILLTDNQRVQGSDSEQRIFRDLLKHIRNGCISTSDWNVLLTRQPTSITNLDEFKDVTRLFYSNEEVGKYNFSKLEELKHPIAKIEARHSTIKAKKISPQELFGLEPLLFLAKGAVVMLTNNLWTSVGLCNGAKGTVMDIIYHPDHKPPSLPIAVVVKFESYSGPSLDNFPSCVPIPPITACVDSIHERQQIPLRLAWALTIHKSQGLTLDKTWIDIGKRETSLGTSYVAISRTRKLSSLVIEPMTLERLLNINKSPNMKYRKAEEQRLSDLANNTTLSF
ncbi:uncharacterized protein LOC110236158 [Exaiptasia diaphana]|uniref:ATP-dependent DNA helicase n=1 Tax=Exaiptasia diaphana TaxID=2652724 RepID=A0A913X166_EXADI|nr:uncharacterized protein LOC110236158 [Exaiptasia diaphana]